MTVQPLFDTARFRDRLTSSGMPEGQARALTEGLDEAIRGASATKADLEKLGDRMDARFAAVDARFEQVNARFEQVDARFDTFEKRLDESIGRRIAESQASQLRWIVASLFGGLGLLFAALKLIP